MKRFIEVTVGDEKTILNTDWIFAVEHHDSGCLVKVGANGYRDNAFQYYYVSESYEQVKELLFNSVPNVSE